MAIFKKAGHWYIDYYVGGQRKRDMIGPKKRQAELVLQRDGFGAGSALWPLFGSLENPGLFFSDSSRGVLQAS